MADDLSALFDEDDSRRAAEAVQGAYGYGAPAAISAFKDAPDTGVDPALGMTDPQPQMELAQQDRDSRTLAASPPLQRFAAQGPAHVAATQGGWPQMKRLGDFFSYQLGSGGEFPNGPPTKENVVTRNFLRPLHDIYLDAVSNIPQQIATNPPKLFDPRTWFQDPKFREATPQEKADTLTNIAINAAMVGTNKVIKGPTVDLGPATEVFPQPRLRGPSGGAREEPVIDAEFEPLKPPGVNPRQNEFYTQQAEADAAVAQRAGELVKDIPHHSQVPELTSNFIEQTAVAGQKVWVDPNAILKAYSEGHQPFQPMAQEIGEALNSGREVEMPLSTYLSETAGQPFEEAIRNATRFREDGVSVDQAADLGTAEPAGGAVEGVQGAKEAGGPTQREVSLPEDIGPEHAPTARNIAAQADTAVEEVFQELALKGLFAEPKDLKLSATRMERYDSMLAEAKAAASDRILNKHYAQIRKERTPEWKDSVVRERYAAEQALSQNRVINAMMELQYGQGPKGEPLERPGLKLSRASVREEYGDTTVAGLPRNMFGAEGVSADDAAEVMGYPSGQELLSDLLDLEAQRTQGGYASSKALIAGMLDREAEAAARRKLGYDISPEGIAAAAREAAVLPKVEDFLIAELRALGEEAGFPLNTDDLKYEASRQFDQLPVREAKNVRTFERGMWRTGERALKAMEKGDVVGAFLARQQQLLNFYQLEAAHFLAKKWAQGEKKFRRLARKPTIRGLSQPFLNQLHTYLPRFGFNVNREPQELAESLQGKTLEEFVADVIATDADFPSVPSVPGRSMEQLRVSDYWKVRAFIFGMDRYGRELQKAISDGKRVEKDAVIEAALASIPPGKPPKGPPKPTPIDNTKSAGQNIASFLKSFDAFHRKAADFIEWMDRGDPLGVWSQNTTLVMNEGANVEGVLEREMYKPVRDAWAKVPREVKQAYNRKIAAPFTAGGRPLEVYRRNILRMALYAGTKESLEKAAKGFGVEPDAYLAVVNAHISPEEVEMVETIWDHFEALAPKVSTELRALTGQGLRRVEAASVVLGQRKLRGGYVPIAYNRNPLFNPQVLVWEAEREAQLSPDGLDQLFAELLPNKGFAEERTDYVGPLDVELAGIARLFNSHIKYAAYARPVSDVRKFISNPLIAAAIQEKWGEEYNNILPDWLNGVVRPYSPSEKMVAKAERVIEHLGRNMTAGALTFSYGTLVSQAAGFVNGVAVLSDGNIFRGVSAMLMGYKDGIEAALSTRIGPDGIRNQLLHEMFEQSEFMRQRYGALEQNMTEALMEADDLVVRGAVREGIRHIERVGYQLIGWVEFATVSAPTWYAAKRQALGKGLSDEDAVKFADRMVTKSQGGGRRVDLAAVQRTRGLMKLAYAFQSYFNQQYQLMVDVQRNVAGAGGGGRLPPPPDVLEAEQGDDGVWRVPKMARYSNAQAAILAVLVFVLGGVIANFLQHRKNTILDPLLNLMRPMFAVNSFAQVISRHFEVKDGKVGLKNAYDASFGDDLYNRAGEIVVQNAFNLALAVQGKKTYRPVQNAFGLAQLGGLPAAAAMGRSAEYIYELNTKQQRPREGHYWTDLYFGLMNGPQPEQQQSSKLRY